jgi:hypothetical protein
MVSDEPLASLQGGKLKRHQAGLGHGDANSVMAANLRIGAGGPAGLMNPDTPPAPAVPRFVQPEGECFPDNSATVDDNA